MTEQEIQENINHIEQVYTGFQKQLSQLNMEQDSVILDFIRNLENARLQELRNHIANLQQ